MVTADKVKAIRTKAEALAGKGLGENGDLLVEIAASIARALCCREDIPEDMEAVVAQLALLAGRESDQSGVKSITRGDTSVTYVEEVGERFGEIVTQLSPFRRLGRLRREEA